MRQLLQDMIAPDLKALTYKVDGIQEQLELTEKSMMAQLDAFRAEMNDFRAEMRSEFQSQRSLLQNEVLRETSPIRERIATLEGRRA